MRNSAKIIQTATGRQDELEVKKGNWFSQGQAPFLAGVKPPLKNCLAH